MRPRRELAHFLGGGLIQRRGFEAGQPTLEFCFKKPRRLGGPWWPGPSIVGCPGRARGVGTAAGRLRCRWQRAGPFSAKFRYKKSVVLLLDFGGMDFLYLSWLLLDIHGGLLLGLI